MVVGMGKCRLFLPTPQIMAEESTSLYGISPVNNSHNTTPKDLERKIIKYNFLFSYLFWQLYQIIIIHIRTNMSAASGSNVLFNGLWEPSWECLHKDNIDDDYNTDAMIITTTGHFFLKKLMSYNQTVNDNQYKNSILCHNTVIKMTNYQEPWWWSL